MSRVSGVGTPALLSRPLSASLQTRPTQVICKSAAKQPPVWETIEAVAVVAGLCMFSSAGMQAAAAPPGSRCRWSTVFHVAAKDLPG